MVERAGRVHIGSFITWLHIHGIPAGSTFYMKVTFALLAGIRRGRSFQVARLRGVIPGLRQVPRQVRGLSLRTCCMLGDR